MLMQVLEQLDLLVENEAHIAEMITSSLGRCMSDGSLKDTNGISAFVFIMPDEENGYCRRNHIPGMNVDQSLYKSELCRILGNLRMINPVSALMASNDLVAAIWHKI